MHEHQRLLSGCRNAQREFCTGVAATGERIRGRDNFAVLNSEYPAHGPWRFTINRIVASDTEVVTDVSVTDGVVKALAITFSITCDGKITY